MTSVSSALVLVCTWLGVSAAASTSFAADGQTAGPAVLLNGLADQESVNQSEVATAIGPSFLGQGYALRFCILDADPADKETDRDPPNVACFKQALKLWAEQQHLSYPGLALPGQSTPTGFKVLECGWFRAPEQFCSREILVTLPDDSSLLSSLTHELSLLPGVLPPQVEPSWFYDCLFPLTELEENAVVQINGKDFSYPEDFSAAEAAEFYWQIKGASEPSTAYLVYPQRRWQKTAQRFELGDVVRVERGVEGKLVLNTLLKDFRPELNDPVLTSRSTMGWSVDLPAGTDEGALDVGQFVVESLVDDAYRHTSTYLASINFWLLDRQTVLEHPSASLDSAQLQAAEEIGGKLQLAFDGWAIQHPEFRWPNGVKGRASAGIMRFAGQPVVFSLSISTDELTQLDELRRTLESAAPGLFCELHLQDLRAEMHKREAAWQSANTQ